MKISLKNKAKELRKEIFRMVTSAKSGHLGASFSCLDILISLYYDVMKIDPKNPANNQRDRFILSKGHGCTALYAILSDLGYFPKEWLKTYLMDGTKLGGHPSSLTVPGVELSTGSLGHGLSVGCGMAMAAKHDSKKHRIFVLISDGECDEGSTWEAVLSAAHFKLDNLTVIVDYNKIQSFGRVPDVLKLEPFLDKWKSFGFSVKEVNGHDHQDLCSLLSQVPFETGKPNCVIAHTVKGKGVSFMENTVEWHYLTPTIEQMNQAIKEIDEGA